MKAFHLRRIAVVLVEWASSCESSCYQKSKTGPWICQCVTALSFSHASEMMPTPRCGRRWNRNSHLPLDFRSLSLWATRTIFFIQDLASCILLWYHQMNHHMPSCVLYSTSTVGAHAEAQYVLNPWQSLLRKTCSDWVFTVLRGNSLKGRGGVGSQGPSGLFGKHLLIFLCDKRYYATTHVVLMARVSSL